MPSDLYHEDENGHLVWSWEQHLTGEDGYIIYEGENMPFKKKEIKKKIEIPCVFCGKDIKDRIYIVKKKDTTYKTCSGCKFVFNVLYEETKNGKDKVLRLMLTYCNDNPRHCTNCKLFSPHQTQVCKGGYHTGIGYERTSYPNSYANHGCRVFERM